MIWFIWDLSLISRYRFGYCIQVYLRSLMDDTTTTDDNSSGLPSYSGSVRTVSASQAYRRVRRVIELQWRGIAIVIIIIADVVFFSVVFVYLDNTTQESKSEVDKATPWLLCLVLNGGDKTKCLDLASKLVLNEATVMAVLILLSLNGYWCALLLGRWSMVIGWIDLIKKRFTHRQEFVSVDARRLSADPRTYEMLTSPHPIDFKSMEDPGLQSPAVHPTLSRSFSVQKDVAVDDYFGREARYASPTSSFSAPKAPSTVKGREWDPQATYAKGSRPYGWRDIEAYGSRRDVELGRT
ncbi:MAG: hypothetical protein M1827_004269 [Pycnora praestabilis]|nr:MAG: hypothetical protein M1827_004269 [Pycnora praestabilis]